MIRRLAQSLALASLVMLLQSCAVTDGQDELGVSSPPPPPQPAARLGLAPAYRAFYDELADYGDWVLIEPYGWCFRPAVNFDAWRPYEQGWWEPSDVYGWVWNSTEEFGWITYHYGTWFYDTFQGWVWQPGPAWGPAWVAWVSVGEYVGWAPLAPYNYSDFSRLPGGIFTFASARQFATQDLSSQALFVNRLPATRAPLTEISNFAHANGTIFNRGPDFTTLQRLGAAIPVRKEPEVPAVAKLPVKGSISEADLRERTNRLVAEGAREYAAVRAGSDAAVPVPGVLGQPSRTPMRKPPARPMADSTAIAPRPDSALAPAGPPRKPTFRAPRKPGARPDSTRG